MIKDFKHYINESRLKRIKKILYGPLDMSARKKMREELRDNIITFKFEKRNGDIRKAHGTLHPSYLPPLKGGSPKPEMQMVYYDLDKEEWRSFRSYKFIKIINIKPVSVPSHKPSPSKAKVKAKHAAAAKSSSDGEEEEMKDVEMTGTGEKREKDKEKEEESSYKSPIYDESSDEKKEREEDDEDVEKVRKKSRKKTDDE